MGTKANENGEYEYDGPPGEARLAVDFAESADSPRGLVYELGEWRADGRDEPLEDIEVMHFLLGFLGYVIVDGERLRVTRRLLDDVYRLLEVERYVSPWWREVLDTFEQGDDALTRAA